MGLLPMLKGCQHATMIAHGFQNLRERRIVPLREQVAERVRPRWQWPQEWRCETSNLAELQVRIGRRVVISDLTWAVSAESVGRVRAEDEQILPDPHAARAELCPASNVPSRSDRHRWAGIARLHNIQIAGFDGGCDVLEQEHLAERDPKRAVRPDKNCFLFILKKADLAHVWWTNRLQP